MPTCTEKVNAPTPPFVCLSRFRGMSPVEIGERGYERLVSSTAAAATASLEGEAWGIRKPNLLQFQFQPSWMQIVRFMRLSGDVGNN